MNTFDYESYSGDYQYRALHGRNPVQRFWHQKKLEFAKEKLGALHGKKILDVGCGSGHLCFALAGSCKEIIGIDISQHAIEFAQNMKQKLNLSNVIFMKTDPDSFPFQSESFDAVIMMELVEHLENPAFLLAEALRVLKKNGRIFITTPNYKSCWPLVEWLLDYFHLTPPLKGHQHISKFNRAILQKLLEPRVAISDQGSFYVISPFLSFCWPLAHKIFVLENRLRLRFGMLLYALGNKK